jgi:tripartite-type tricarboxylate transporter receptor subunit TctC
MVSRREFTRAMALAPLALPAIRTSAFAQAQDYPSGPIRAICSFAPGSGADVKVRFYANKLQQALGNKTVIVENRPGAFGNIATETVAKAKPDGLTIYIAPGSSTLAASPALFKKLSYDPVNDFEHITTLNTSAFVLCVDASRPFHTLADLTQYLKAQGDKASYGSIANTGLVASEMYKAKLGLKTIEIKYKEAGPLFNDLYAGNIAFFHIDAISVEGPIQQGRMRPLAMTSAKRMRSSPNVPGAEEAGIPGMDIVTWWSVEVPAKTPKPICDKLETLFNAMGDQPDTLKFLLANGSDPFPGNSKMLKELLINDIKAWAEYARIAKIEPI